MLFFNRLIVICGPISIIIMENDDEIKLSGCCLCYIRVTRNAKKMLRLIVSRSTTKLTKIVVSLKSQSKIRKVIFVS